MVLVAITLFGFMEVQDKRGAVKENLNRIWRISTMIDIKCTPLIINKILSITHGLRINAKFESLMI